MAQAALDHEDYIRRLDAGVSGLERALRGLQVGVRGLASDMQDLQATVMAMSTSLSTLSSLVPGFNATRTAALCSIHSETPAPVTGFTARGPVPRHAGMNSNVRDEGPSQVCPSPVPYFVESISELIQEVPREVRRIRLASQWARRPRN